MKIQIGIKIVSITTAFGNKCGFDFLDIANELSYCHVEGTISGDIAAIRNSPLSLQLGRSLSNEQVENDVTIHKAR
jgi:hypothetical protein